jgi:hypothetical protein
MHLLSKGYLKEKGERRKEKGERRKEKVDSEQ